MSGITRVTTLAQNTQNLLNLLRNEQSLNDVLLQQSSGLKAPTFAGVAPQAGQLLNVNALSSQAQGFLNNITSAATTRLNLTDTTLASIGSLASNFQQELQQLQSSPTPPNISDLARTSLAQLASLLDSSDGSQFLFAGSQQNAPPSSRRSTPREFPTTTLTLCGQSRHPGPGAGQRQRRPARRRQLSSMSASAVRMRCSTVPATNTTTTVRFVHQSATSWQAYLVKDGAHGRQQPVRAELQRPADLRSQPGRARQAVQPGGGRAAVQSASTTRRHRRICCSSTIRGRRAYRRSRYPRAAATIKINVDANTITNTAGASGFTQADNATPTTQIVLNQLNLDPTTPLGDTTSITR